MSTITTNLTVADELDVYISQPNVDLEVNILGGTAPYSYLWNTQSISSTIAPTSNGNYWVLITDDVPCYADTAFFNVENFTTAINEYDYIGIELYPNQTTGILNLNLDFEKEELFTLQIKNILGQSIYFQKSSTFQRTYKTQINLDQFSEGIYNVEIITDNNKITKQIIVNK